MIDLTESLLKAISIIADKSVEEVSSDTTIKAIVKKVVSTSDGKYLVTYNDGDFYAYVQSGSTDVYQTGEEIYILVPEGDMSQKKFIVGKVKDDNDYSGSKILSSSLLNDYIMIGDNIVIEEEYSAVQLEENSLSEDCLDVVRMQPLKLDSHAIQKFHYCYLHDPSIITDLTDYNTITNRTINIDEESFINSAKQAEALLIRAKFKTDLDTDNIGNFGIIVNIAFADETNPQTDDEGNISYPPKLIAYVLDASKMTGNPMKFYDYSSQYIIAPFDGKKYLYIDSIVAFSEGFVTENTEPHDEYDDVYIYMDGLEIIALNEISAINGNYKLRLTTPKGNTIKSGRKDELKINAIMSYLNQDITQDTAFYWGVKDLSVTSSHEKYNSKLGSGYRWLDTELNYELILSPTDLTATENIYACVAVYETDIILKAFVSLYNNNNKINITIESDQGTSFQFNEGNPTLTCLINNKTENYQVNYPDEAFSFVWSKEDPDFGIILLDKTEELLAAEREAEIAQCTINNGLSDAGRTTMEILSYYSTRIAQVQNISYPDGIYGSKITCKLKNTNSYVTYSCSVYKGGVYIGYGSIVLQNHKNVVNNNYYITITNGSQVFQYDESGVSPSSQKQQNPLEVSDLIAVFHDPQGAEVTPKKVRWIMPQGPSLINIPSLGLETDFETGEKYFSGTIFPLTIKDIYDNSYNDNQVIAIVTHADGTEYRQSSNLLFTKVGEIGTNGTDSVVKINEEIEIPIDECLTLIKSAGQVFYNGVEEHVSTNRSALRADLYTNNTKTLGYTAQWSIAGNSEGLSRNYLVETDLSDNTCRISYNSTPVNTCLDTRIIKVQTNLNGKYLYSFYGLPTIEYQVRKNNNDQIITTYTYDNYPIKIMRDGTLKTILYDSNGTNPSYNENQGIHIELPGWEDSGYLEWSVESGIEENIGNSETPVFKYENPNILLSKTAKSKTGSKTLSTVSNIDEIQSLILEVQDSGKNCAENANNNIKKYINEFLADIEKIGIDSLLSSFTKINSLKERISVFKDKTPDKKNIYIQTVYEKYLSLFEQMESEYEDCKNINEEYTRLYNKVQEIWKSEWPNVITNSRLSVEDVTINNIQDLVQRYQEGHINRSNEDSNAIQVPSRSIFNNDFLALIGDESNKNTNNATGLDLCYRKYYNSSGATNNFDSILIEYAKVLITYLLILVNETQASLTTNNNDNTIRDRYSFIYRDWDMSELEQEGHSIIGKNIYDVIFNADGIAANIYDNVRSLYQYYQSLYIDVQNYQISEDSDTLNIWTSILKGENINLLKQIYIIPKDTFSGLYMNNNVVGIVSIKDNNEYIPVAKVYVPIIMTLNTYELAALNGWDGTTIDIGEDHITTPQIGAGIKDSVTNTFTGMVMGSINNTNINTTSFKNKIDKAGKVGLIGYSNGKQSVFIDSKTGRAYFGLPEDDIGVLDGQNDENATKGTNEGRIELIPGGVSKIGNWKIGSRFLYNIVEGNYERRLDKLSSHNDYKMMVPHDKHGIILSSDKPYIHIKGEVYQKNNLKNIDYSDEYNNINAGDSLELRLDPGNDSLFSIVQHTVGFGDEENDNLLFGYKYNESLTTPSNNTIVRDYVINQNFGDINTPQDSNGAEYHIYRLDMQNGAYKPYYQKNNGTPVNKTLISPPFNIINGTKNLSNTISQSDFQRMTGNNPVFSINTSTGVVIYNPTKLNWGNEWQSITGYSSFNSNNFNISLNYNKDNNNNVDTTIKVGTITNSTGSNIYQVSFNYSLVRELKNISFTDADNTYIQFYICVNDSDNIDSTNTKLVSNKLSIWDNNEDVVAELFSRDGGYLANGSSYKLKIKVYVENYTIDSNYLYAVNRTSNIVKQLLITPAYGTVDIGSSGSTFTITNGSVSKTGSYTMNSSGKLQVKLNSTGTAEYDVLVWRDQIDSPVYGGRIRENNTYIDFKDEADNLHAGSVNLSPAPSSSVNDWHMSFYPRNTFIMETVEGYDLTSTTGTVNIRVGNCTTAGATQTKSVTVNGLSSLTDGAKISITFTQANTHVEPKLNVSNTGAKFIKASDGENLSEAEYQWAANSTIIFIYDATNEVWRMHDSADLVQGNVDISLSENISYSFISPIFNDTITYGISFSNYSLINFSYGLKITAIKIEDIYGFSPADENTEILCIQGNTNTYNLQGIRYAVTYWDINQIQRIRLYKEYYKYVNNNTSSKSQYGYVDTDNNGGICYKYIKTLKKTDVNRWFIHNTQQDGLVHSDDFETIDGIDISNWIDISTDKCQDIVNWKEFIRVGLDENGRFYSAGLQDKKTYSRTGRMLGFGKVSNLYGQEIRTMVSNNNYMPIIKIFSKMTDNSSRNTTYITQGKNDNGNISIRTAGNNHYIELGASQNSENEVNSIPEAENFVKVSYNHGIQIQAKNEITTNTIDLTGNKGLSINASMVTIASNNIGYQLSNNYAWTKAPYLVISSLLSRSSSSAYTSGLGGVNDNSNGHYRIKAFSDGINPTIDLQVGRDEAGIKATHNQVTLKASRNRYIVINNVTTPGSESNLSKFVVDDMELNFNSQILTLKNRNSFIIMQPETEGSSNRAVLISSSLGGKVELERKVNIKGNGGLTVSDGPGIFEKYLSTQANLYSSNNLYVGYDPINKTSDVKGIYLYKDTDKHYVRLLAADLQKLFDWYNQGRWAIGYSSSNHTLWLRNVNNNMNPEGRYESSENKYYWSFQPKFSSYSTNAS